MEPNSFARLNQSTSPSTSSARATSPICLALCRGAAAARRSPALSGKCAASTGCRTYEPRPGTSSRSPSRFRASPCRRSTRCSTARTGRCEQPTAFDINTSIQRCLVKAIALHGLGLYIYAGEDLPAGAEAPKPIATPIQGQRTITPAQLRYLKRLIVEAKSSEDHIKDYFNLDRMEDLPMREFDRALQALRRAA